METDPEPYLELARVAGRTWSPRGEENDPGLDVDPSQFVRLSPPSFGPLGRPSWRTVKSHCLSVYQSECFYRCISEEQWLRTVVTCNPSDGFFSILSTHSNVMPKQAYLTWFKGIKATCPEHQCSLGFFPASYLAGEMMELNAFPGLCCSDCAFEDQLRHPLVPAELVHFWWVEETDVRVVDDHTEVRAGSDGEVCKILWRHGTFARKRFNRANRLQYESFLREFDVALKVSHPNIVHSFGFSDGSSNCSLYMEWLKVDLQRFLQERDEHGVNPPFSFQQTLVVLLQVAEAVKHLHEEGFVHGDLKPGNLLVSEMAMPPSVAQFYLVKVADFGRTQRVDSSGFSYGLGTEFYTAPEVYQCRDLQKSSPPGTIPADLIPPECRMKIDVYSFGVVAYQVVTGVPTQNLPTRSYNFSSVRKPDGDKTQWRPSLEVFDRLRPLGEYLSSLRTLIKSCWASSPHDRPTFQKICQDLQQLYNQLPPEGRHRFEDKEAR